uniref:Ribosomal protein S10 n=1 Tax=Botryococcus braunii TaxID=38881 RepID=A0A0U2EZZ7_BOTBR|nr:ribosomal protein S10 [Botryococcus braunii]AKU37103.1 ribosomal protein S10 [Botryococcus braunii]
MYKIEISLKSHQLLSLKRGVKSLQQLIRAREKIFFTPIPEKKRILKENWLPKGDEKRRTLDEGVGLSIINNQRFSLSKKGLDQTLLAKTEKERGKGLAPLTSNDVTRLSEAGIERCQRGFASPLTWNVRPTRGFLPQAVGDWAKIEKTAKYFVVFSSTPVPEQCNRYWLRSSDPFSDRLKLAKRNGESLFFQSSYGLALPRLQKKWTVLRSPHIDKKSREQFEWTRCKEKIHIFSTQREVTLYLLSLLRHSEIPGVELELQLQSLTFFKRTATK